ncbi:MAG: tetratricopeptide repeat protein [Nitrospirota bacterium]|nr:tetratricopeptide repeat protein [Nitrospirota bacterium]
MKKRIIIFCSILLLTMASAAYAYDETYEKAMKHFNSREYSRAIPYLENYVVQKPDPAVYYMLGYAYYQLKKYDRSKDYFDQAYLIDPDFSSDSVPVHSGLSREEQGLIHDALDLSGAKKQMENYADNLSSTLPQFRAGMSDRKQTNDILLFLRDSYRINKIYPPVVNTFSARFNKKYMLSVIQWLKSPLGMKSAGLEVAANLPEMMKKSAAYQEEYDRMQEGRKQRIRDMEKAVRATELNVHIVAVSLFEMLKGMQTGMQGSGKMNSEEIDALVGNVRGIPREQITRDVLGSLAFTYLSLTDEELDEVVRFYRSPEGRWFTDTSIEAVSSAIGKASREVGEKMGSALLMKKVMM